MKKPISLLLYSLILYSIEFILCISLFFIESSILYGLKPLTFGVAVESSIEVNALRFILYFPFNILLIYMFHSFFKEIECKIKYSIFNTCCYLFICIIYISVFFGAVEYFNRTFFYFLIIATFLSPIIANLSRTVQKWDI